MAACAGLHTESALIAMRHYTPTSDAAHYNEIASAVAHGKGVSSLSGKFDRVDVPAGWLYDLKYDYEKPQVVIKNFRPDHVPSRPSSAE